ncbi:MAG: hypothetical protein ACTSQG_00020 [Promethearchaeota archaeon]
MIKKGDVIKIKKEHRKFINESFEGINSLQDQIKNLSKIIRNEKNKIWDFVRDVYPQTKYCDLSYDSKKKTVLITDQE